MKRNNTENIGDVLRRFLREEGLETPLNEKRLLDAWNDVLDPFITSYTKDLFIKNQVLYVHLTSAPLRQELMMRRQKLVDELNRHVGATVITNIMFR